MPSVNVFNLLDFRKKITSVGLNQYFVVKIPTIGDFETMTALARTASLPAFTVNTLDVPFRGLAMKIADKPTFPEWSVTFLCDQAHTVRHAFLKWMSKSYQVQTLRNAAHGQYKVDGASVSQLAYNGEITSTAIFYGLFPSSVGEIGLDQAGGTVQTVAVNFAYDYYLMNDINGDVKDSTLDFDVSDEGVYNNVTVKGVAGVKFTLNNDIIA
jgi:hypothetical protein